MVQELLKSQVRSALNENHNKFCYDRCKFGTHKTGITKKAKFAMMEKPQKWPGPMLETR